MLIASSVSILHWTVTEMATRMKILLCIVALMAPAMTHAHCCCPVPTTTLKEASNTFTSNMFPEVVRDNEGGNCVQSAFSVMFPLGQLALASVGPSHDQILRAMAMPNDATIKQEFSAYTSQLGSFKEIEIHLANRVYVRSGYVLTKEFKEEVRNDFLGTVQTVDFSKKSATAEKINSYIEDHTNKRIRNAMDATDINSETVAIIVNAAEYKGIWEHEFNEDNTRERPFYVNAHSNTTVKMMRQTNTFKYGESGVLDAKLVELPYKDSDVRFVAVLPNRYNEIDALINKVRDPVKLMKGLQAMQESTVSVGLPKFKIETKTNLKVILTRMGVGKLFTRGEAHLDKMVVGENDLFVSSAIQKTFIEVNEEGSRAAAGSRFGVDEPNTSSEDPKSFLADHPFLFYLVDKNNMILFNGVFRQ